MDNKNIIFNHTLEQYNKKYRNRRHRLIKYTKKQVEDFDKQFGHYSYNGKTHSLEFNNYLLENRKWWFTKEDECYHEIPRPIRFTWFRNLSAGVQVATCALLAGGVIAGSTIGIIEYKKYDASLVVMGKGNTPVGVNYNIEAPKTTDTGDISYKIDITTTESYKPTIEGGKPELVDVSVKKGSKELEKFTDFNFNSATGEVIIKKESEEKYYGKTVITPTIKTITHTDQREWLEIYKDYSDNFQGKESNKDVKRYEIDDIKVLGLFKTKKGNFVEASLNKLSPVVYGKSGSDNEIIAQLIFDDPIDKNFIYRKEIGGGKYSCSRIVNEVFGKLSEYKIDYIIGDKYVKFDAYLNDVLDVSCTFDSNGYITNTYGFSSDGASQLIIEYKGNPEREESYNYLTNGLANVGGKANYKFNAGNEIYLEKDKKYRFCLKTVTYTNPQYPQYTFVLGVEYLDLGITTAGTYYKNPTITIDGVPSAPGVSSSFNKIYLPTKIIEPSKNIIFDFTWFGNTTKIIVKTVGTITTLG